MNRTIEITVSPTGELHIEAIGFKGSGCKDATKALELALGTVQDSKHKPEFHQQARRTAQQKLGM